MQIKLFKIIVAGLLVSGPALAAGNTGKIETAASVAPKQKVRPEVIIDTSMGIIKLELWPDKAPETVSNFLHYTDNKFYDGLIFHRVIPGFMIQGGGFSPEMQQKKTGKPVRNEARADTPNKRGTIAMARTMIVDSATSQFFINLKDNTFLNHRDNTPRGFGYCVFGRVIDGMDVVDAIAGVPTERHGPYQNVPVKPVIIKSIRRADVKQ